MDRVYVKFVNWVEWGKAAYKTIKNVDFDEHEKLIHYCTEKMRLDPGFKLERFNEATLEVKSIGDDDEMQPGDLSD